MDYKLTTPFSKKDIAAYKAGDRVLLTGQVYTARDAAHARMADRISEGKPLPFLLDGACIYYAGPTPAPPGRAVGAAGPTTSGRMDKLTPLLLANGLAAMIGKGPRSKAVVEAIRRYKAVYFGFIGGAGALAASCVTASELVAWEELGSEAVRLLTVKDFPLTVLVDSEGSDLYQIGPKAYLQSRADAPAKAGGTGRPATVDGYREGLAGEGRVWVDSFVAFMRSNFPEVSEGLTYQTPCYQNDKTYVVFSASKDTFSLQMPNEALLGALRQTMPYAQFGKGSVKVPLTRADARTELLLAVKRLFEGWGGEDEA